MKLKDKHSSEKGLSATSLFTAEEGKVVTIQILKGQLLKEHLTKTPALLICVEGEAVFENEKGVKEALSQGDYVNIEAMVKHWVNALADSQLVLIK